jgi:hypothetical protein
MPTLGEDRVRVQFNPSRNSLIEQIKQKSAELIDICETLTDRGFQTSERLRLVRLAQTAYEEAAMWAVKAATS